jgi:hypothetical protein
MANLNVTVQDANNINVQVTPTPKQVIQINRGVAGKDGGDNIGGYPVVITAVQPQDVIMFGTNEWVNTPQTEIADGGNF